MTRPIRLILIGLTVTFFTCCKHSKFDSNDIAGTWYYVFNDSIYGEVIFTDKELWEWSTGGGTWIKDYKIEGDSFKIGHNYITSGFERKDKDEFVATNKHSTTRYYRLKEKVDVAGLLKDDEHVLDQYVKEWRERKFYWERMNNKN